MKVQKRTMYNIVFYFFVGITCLCYFWGLYSLIRWIVSLF